MNGIYPLKSWNRFVYDYSKVLDASANAWWNYWTDIHPKSETQYQQQMFLRGISPWYDTWMVNRSVDERNRHTRDLYNLNFGDITYPHLSGVLSENTTKQYGSTAWQFSKNMSRLYR